MRVVFPGESVQRNNTSSSRPDPDLPREGGASRPSFISLSCDGNLDNSAEDWARHAFFRDTLPSPSATFLSCR